MDSLLTTETTRWIESKIGTPIRSVSQLKGATSSTLYKIIGIDDRPIVLRLLTNADWLASEPDLARHEAAALDHVNLHSNASQTYPRCIAYDESGSDAGLAAVLMSFVDGDVVLPQTADAEWVAQLASTLTAIHQLPVDGFEWRYRHWFKLDQLKQFSFSWSSIPHIWQQGVSFLDRPDPTFTPRFLHRDYHPVNLLWQDKEVSGVVDWVNACVGPPLVDVGHCRVNLTSLYGLEMANLFLEKYLEMNPTVDYTPFWDLTCMLSFGVDEPPSVYSGWLDFGFSGLTPKIIASRMDSFIASLF
ncbi:MAG: aminoglycoside phosphotransferase family protein [Chloroflexota bacterium]